MKKIIYIVVLLILLFSVFSLKAQDKVGYWDDVDFSDTTLVGSKVMSDRMVGYFFSFTDGDEKHFDSLSIVGLNVLLDKAKVNMRMYEYILEFALNGYANMGRDAVTDYLLNYPQLAEGEITMEEGLRLDSITEPYQKVKVGAKAPDFKGFTIENKPYCIYDSKAPYTIVVFWSTDCEYCHEFLVQIRKHLDLTSDFELVTFALADDEAEVSKTIKKMRLPGYHFYDEMRWDSKAFLDYHITTTPTVFVLDENKVIVCKPYDWQDLKYWLKSNYISY
ncbi:MAG: redoxin domain-containing protein [Bacteroidales bacterium]|nr:redoxin domain-containing protein [Bacteroidales bacterium]